MGTYGESGEVSIRSCAACLPTTFSIAIGTLLVVFASSFFIRFLTTVHCFLPTSLFFYFVLFFFSAHGHSTRAASDILACLDSTNAAVKAVAEACLDIIVECDRSGTGRLGQLGMQVGRKSDSSIILDPLLRLTLELVSSLSSSHCRASSLSHVWPSPYTFHLCFQSTHLPDLRTSIWSPSLRKKKEKRNEGEGERVVGGVGTRKFIKHVPPRRPRRRRWIWTKKTQYL